MRQTSEIIVTPTGETIVQTMGFVGTTCREASRLVERALGRQTQETLTAEFHKASTPSQDQQQQHT